MKNWKKIFSVAVIGLLVVIGVSEFVMQQDYVQIQESFEDPEYIKPIEVGELVAVNDVVESENGYIIDGTDAYFVYAVDIDKASAVEIVFEDELEVAGMVRIFYAAEGMPFSEDNSASASFSKGAESVQVPIQMQDVGCVRVDIDVDKGTEVNIVALRQDTRTARNSDIFCFSGFYLFGGIYLTVLVGYVLNLKYAFMKKQKIRYWSIVVAVWAGVIIVTFMPVLCGKYNLSSSNMMYTVQPWNCMGVGVDGPILSDSIDSALPGIYQAYYGDGYTEWNKNEAFGTPGIGAVTYLNPMNWFYFLPIKWAILLSTVFKISVAYFGMCYLLRTLKLEVVSTVVGAASYALSSAMIMWLFWPHTSVMMLAPIVLALGVELVRNKKLSSMFVLALATFFMLVAEMPTYAAYVMYLLGFYVLIMTIVKYRKKYKDIISVYSMFAGAMIMAIVAAFPYLYTILSTVGQNGYAESRRDDAMMTLPAYFLRTAILPYYDEGLYSHINERTLYFGIVILVLLIWLGFGWKRKEGKYWSVALAIISLFSYSHVLDFVFKCMPAINTSKKYRIIILVALLACIVGAINLNDIIKNKELYREKKWRWLAYTIVTSAAVYIYIAYADATIWAVWASILMMAVITGIEILISVQSENATALCKFALIAVTVINMGIFAQQYLPFVDKDADIIPEATESIQYIQDNIEDGRIYAISEDGWNLFPNTYIFYNIPSITSHSFINTYNGMSDYLLAIDGDMMETPTAYHGFKIDNYNLLKYGGVKYIVKPTDYEQFISEGITLVFAGNDGEEVYEIDDYNGRLFLSEEVSIGENRDQILEEMQKNYTQNQVWIYEDEIEYIWGNSPLEETEEIKVLEDSADYIKVEVTTTEQRIMVLNEYNDGKWKAYVDGKEADVICVNYLFKGVAVDAGTHTIEFVYDLSTERMMLIVAMISIGGTVIGIAVTCTRAKIVNQRKNRSESI